MKRLLTFSICTVLSLLIFTSCAKDYQTSDDFYGGESLNADILSSIAESIFNEVGTEENGKNQGNVDLRAEHDGVYYWTAGGSVYHKWSDCGHLKNSTDVISGSEQDAILAGKQKLCSSCEKKG